MKAIYTMMLVSGVMSFVVVGGMSVVLAGEKGEGG